MQRAKVFFLVCAGVFLLALAYHLGASSAGAQVTGQPITAAASSTGRVFAFAANGDAFRSWDDGATWTRVTNVFTATGPTPAQPTTFGAIKAKYR
jgi:hypothetical protein